MSYWTTTHRQVLTQFARKLIVAGITLSFGAGCSDSGTGRCQYQSSSNSGGICRVDLTCGGVDLAASCTDSDCNCIVNGARTAQSFAANGFCDQSEAEQSQRAEASCTLPSDAGSTGDASGDDPRCESLVYNGMACHAEDVGATCAGTAACFCSGPVNVSTTCVCEEGTAFGRAWRCEDACKSACTPDAGSPATDAGSPDAAAKPDEGAAGSACFLAPQCMETITGSANSLAAIAKICDQAGGSYVAACDTDHHDQCMLAQYELVIYTDKNNPLYDSVTSKAECEKNGGVFTP